MAETMVKPSVSRIVGALSLLPLFMVLAFGSDLLVFWLILVSGLSFVVFGVDKAHAQQRKKRVPENVLHLLTLVGGVPGSYAGRRWFSHKTLKKSFDLVELAGLALLWATAAAVSVAASSTSGFPF